VAPLLIAALLAAQPLPSGVPEQLPPLALEVKNPRRSSWHLLQLEDVIGPGARVVGPHKPARALLLVGMDPMVSSPAPGGFDLEALAALDGEARRRGGMVVVVLLTLPGQERRTDRAAFDPESQPFVVTADPHGIARRKLGLGAPGRALVVRSDGRIVGAYGPEARGFTQARAAFLQQLEEVSQ
jgi:hypothetical protein